MHIEAVAPSNIAFLKYWGKRDAAQQWPANDSLSMTLSSLVTTTRAQVATSDQITINGSLVSRGDILGNKAWRHLDYLRSNEGFKAPLEISSTNNFPHGAGIASSASGLAALTLAAIGAWTGSSSMDMLAEHGYTRERLSRLAHMGSGSAGRSLWGGFVSWLAGARAEEQSFTQVLPADHWDLTDMIVVTDAGEKSISSTEAHAAAWHSPLFAIRLSGLAQRQEQMLAALKARDMAALGPLLEQEALEMHAVAMTGKPQANYLNKATSDVIAWLRQVRSQKTVPAYFTLDAGPNPHIICATDRAAELGYLLKDAFPHFTVLQSQVGQGPVVRLVGDSPR